MKKERTPLTEEERVVRHREANRRYGLKNKDKIREANRKYRLKNKEEMNERTREWRKKNPEKSLQSVLNWRKRNPEKTKEYYRKTGKEWYRKNYEADSEKFLKRGKEWRKRNPEKVRVYGSKRRAVVRKAFPLDGQGLKITEKVILIFMRLQKDVCAAVSCDKDIRKHYHIDHIIPLSRGGRHSTYNIQILCPLCNHSKHAKTMDEWEK